MKRQFRSSLRALALGAVLLAAACESGENETPASGELTEEEQLCRSICESYVNHTILPAYRSLAEAALEMRTANEALKAEPTDAHMQAAADAWMKARICWERSEGYLIGPVADGNLSIDPHVDSWPLVMEDIGAVLALIETDPAAFTGAAAWSQEGDVIGFHLTEYMLFDSGRVRPASDLTPAMRSYLTAATDALVWDCVSAYVAWCGEENVPDGMRRVFRENPEVAARLTAAPQFMNYAERMITASLYQQDYYQAMNEIPTGIVTIVEEVGANKIAGTYDGGNPWEVESWYSWHSIDDFANNILSVKNAYLGGTDDTNRPEVSFSTFVARKDAGLDRQIREKIEECIAKIHAMGEGGLSFYECVRDRRNAAQVDAAAAACTELFTLVSRSQDYIR